MPSSVNPMTSLGIGLSIANEANDRAAHAEQRARDAELQALRNSGTRPASTDAKLKAERDILKKAAAFFAREAT